jgi:hypothetical protein
MGKHGLGIKAVGLAVLATAIHFEPTALRPAQQIGLLPTCLAAGTLEAIGVNMLFKPLLALLFV